MQVLRPQFRRCFNGFVSECVSVSGFDVRWIADDTDNFAHFGVVVDRLMVSLLLGFGPEIADLKRAEEEALAYDRERQSRAPLLSGGGPIGGGRMGLFGSGVLLVSGVGCVPCASLTFSLW